MALAHRHAIARHQLAEEFYARIAAEFLGHGPEPLLVLGLDAELALPLGIEQVAVAAGQVLPFDEVRVVRLHPDRQDRRRRTTRRSEEHTSELQSRLHLVCRLLLEKKKKKKKNTDTVI